MWSSGFELTQMSGLAVGTFASRAILLALFFCYLSKTFNHNSKFILLNPSVLQPQASEGRLLVSTSTIDGRRQLFWSLSIQSFQVSVCMLPTCMLSSFCGESLSPHSYALLGHFLMAQTPALPKRRGEGRSSFGVNQAEEGKEGGLPPPSTLPCSGLSSISEV